MMVSMIARLRNMTLSVKSASAKRQINHLAMLEEIHL